MILHELGHKCFQILNKIKRTSTFQKKHLSMYGILPRRLDIFSFARARDKMLSKFESRTRQKS